MTSITVTQLLDHLGVTKSHNRPYTSNDNPFSESQFKTLKYHPMFPKKFDCFNEAELFCQHFFSWYNTKHYHSGIAYLTPESVHYGNHQDVLINRHQVLLKAFKDNPRRFNNRQPSMKSLEPVYINPPQTVEIGALQQEGLMAK